MLDKLTTKPRSLLLVDGLGALLTAFMLGVVLARFESFFGVPRYLLYPAAAVGAVYAAYSLGCVLLVKRWRQTHLFIIASANLVYLCATVGVIYWARPTLWGVLYFMGEAAVITILTGLEIKAANRLPK